MSINFENLKEYFVQKYHLDILLWPSCATNKMFNHWLPLRNKTASGTAMKSPVVICSSLHYGKKLCLGLQRSGAGAGALNNEINYLVSRQQPTQNGGNTWSTQVFIGSFYNFHIKSCWMLEATASLGNIVWVAHIHPKKF